MERIDPLRRLSTLPVAVVLVASLLATAPVCAQGFGGAVEDLLVRGDSLLTQGRPSEAIVQYQEVRTLCPDPAQSVSSLFGEARARMELGELLPAAGLLEEAVAAFPDDPRVADLLFKAGYARQRAGEHEQAVALFERALEKEPTIDILPAIKLRLAQGLRLTGRADDVIGLLSDFETAFPDNPHVPTALYALAIAQHDIGEFESSEANYRTIIARFPRTLAAVEAHFELALVLSERGKSAEAIAMYRSYAAFNPSSPLAARALERAGDLLLFRSPGESAKYYALATMKANSNPQPSHPDLALSRWFGFKKTVAGALSNSWVVALLVLILAAGLAGAGLLARNVVRRRRAPDEASA